jgi:hypothetical protein
MHAHHVVLIAAMITFRAADAWMNVLPANIITSINFLSSA